MSYAVELELGNDALQKGGRRLASEMKEATRPLSKNIAHTQELFRRFLGGDDAAFIQLYTLHNQKLFSYCAKILRDHDAAKDITHSVWEKVIALRAEPLEIRNPVGFFLKLARNRCLDYEKHRKFQTPLDSVPENVHPSSSLNELSFEEEAVIEALDRLPAATKEVLVLHYYSDYSFEEIAAMLDKTPNAIWTLASRARNQLKEIVTQTLSKHNAQKNK